MSESASTIQLLGAGALGAVIGWFLYYINRYRTGDVQLSDLVTVIGALGGGTVVAIFPERSDLFGAYGVGLFAGFFGYLLVLFLLVAVSERFTIDWFLQPRPGDRPMEREDSSAIEP